MTITPVRHWLARAAIGFAACTSSVAMAQVPSPTVVPVVDPNDPVERLGVAIRALAASPRDLRSLLAAGQAALDVGDPNAALGFFARAEEVSPSGGEAKAGLGSSLVMIERPDDALRLFTEASALGVRDDAIAKDRGLAYDLRGDNRRAQRDYALALTHGPDDEVTRRYAMSLGISGERAAALKMLDPLLRKQDQGAWRARAFILAMNGDVPGANSVARSLMNDRMASAMAPLLSRLATLNPAERAHAVNFGSVPADGTQLAYLQTSDLPPAVIAGSTPRLATTANPSSGLIPRGEPLGPRVPPATIVPSPAVPAARQPDRQIVQANSVPPKPTIAAPSAPLASQRIDTRVGGRIGPVDPARLPPEARGEPVRIVVTGQTELPPPSGAVATPDPARIPAEPIRVTLTNHTVLPPPSGAAASPVVTAAAPPGVLPPATVPVAIAQASPSPAALSPVAGPPSSDGTRPTISAAAPPPTIPASTTTPAAALARVPGSRLAGLLAGLEPEAESPAAQLPTAREMRAARAAAQRKIAQLAAAAAAEQAAKVAEAEAAAAKRNPARIWVQVATGSNDRGLATTWKRIRTANEAALKGQSAWSTPYKATNRVLVGPMKSTAAARELVSALGKGGVKATLFNSDAGQEVARIGGK